MITHIEIDGFKSFRDFAVDLRPFQVFIGPNSAGKSNLFDAIVLLSHLAGDSTLYEAFRKCRGEISELFTLYPDGQRAEVMSFAVEMLIGKTVTDDLGTTAEVSSTRLRYELEIERREEGGFERLYVTREALRAITGDDDIWERGNIPARARKAWIIRGRRPPYISTEDGVISKHQDGRSGRRQETTAGRLERTILSTVSSAEYPTAYAARQEMLNWRFLQLDPVSLRSPSNIHSLTELLPDGSNLAAVLYRMAREDEFALTDVSRDMANLVPGILRISVQPIIEREEFLIEAETEDHTLFSSRVLSDGTLRLLALVTLRNDPGHQGVLCFEEPENGVHPSRLERIVAVLRSLSTDFERDEEGDLPRQVLVNTHSPSLLPYTPSESMLYVDMRTRMHARETWMIPVLPSPLQLQLFGDTQLQYYTREQVRRFLNPDPQREKLEEIGSTL
jgi:predicted ATPase